MEPIPGFNLRAQVVGVGGAYVKHIQNETRCRVQIKGRGSEFKNPRTNQEDDEPMFLHVAGPDPDMVKEATKLCVDLLDNVKLEYERFKERGANRNRGGYGGGYGDRNDRGGQADYGRGYQGGYGTQPEQGQAAGSPTTATSAEYAAHIAQYYGGVDPYAAYGGYQNYMALYYQYYQQQGAAGGQAGAGEAAPPGVAAAAPGAAPGTAGASSIPPPPPPGDAPGGAAPPPPPPPPGAPPGGYNSV